MQTELFAIPTPGVDSPSVVTPDPSPKKKQKKRPKREIVEPVSLGFFSFDTWVSYHAQRAWDNDGLRVNFTVPVHSDLLEAVNNPEKTEITCKYRVRKNFLWGGLGKMAKVHIEAHLTQGPKGGLYLHCKHVEILEPVPIKGEPLPGFLKKMNKSMQKQC
ncbi:hypothetical protein [Spirosoma oryzicola]|uniref:hypothetical protein n=1 Tax=Spirosoma oryzicola TaxID=2898794 RepID=UPI001E59369C|nr:hypothetical protein [Spirosoma oryzicola]UHG93406.1 hypothetical protein LQ777_10985 [Spirosoma oryzicola]